MKTTVNSVMQKNFEKILGFISQCKPQNVHQYDEFIRKKLIQFALLSLLHQIIRSHRIKWQDQYGR